MPTLYLVGTPIGNLEDMTFRAVRVLGEVAVVAAEDTRKARILFGRFGIKTPLMSYHEQGSQGAKLEAVLRRLEEADVAFISEAGMPSISDPGFGLVRGAIDRGARVEVLPGASAVTTAVAASGLPADRFLFLGFLPRTSAQRRRSLAAVKDLPCSIVVLESPHRVLACLQDIAAALGDRRIAVCRELTKLHEEVFRGTVTEALAHFTELRGEFTLVVEGATETPDPATEDEVEGRLRVLVTGGISAKAAVAQVTKESGRPKKDVYRVQLGLKGKPATRKWT